MADDKKDQEETAEDVETSEVEETEEAEGSEVETSESEDEASEVEDTSEADDDEADEAAGGADDEEESEEAEEASEADSDDEDADEEASDDEASEAEESEADEAEASDAEDEDAPAAVEANPNEVETLDLSREAEKAVAADGAEVAGVAAFFDHPAHLLYAAEETRDSDYEEFDAFSPFPIHGMDDALGLGRSWIPWVTFFAGSAGFMTAVGLQFGIMGYDWPMVYGGKPFLAWPSFVPIIFELTVLLAGVTTGLVMLIAAGCFRKPFIIDKDITNDRFVLWISADDPRFKRDGVVDYMKGLNPSEIRTVKRDHQ